MPKPSKLRQLGERKAANFYAIFSFPPPLAAFLRFLLSFFCTSLNFSDPFFSFLRVPSVLFCFLLAVSAYSSFFDLFQLPSAFLLPSTLQLPSVFFSFLQLLSASCSFLQLPQLPQLPSASFSRHYYWFQLFELKKTLRNRFFDRI